MRKKVKKAMAAMARADDRYRHAETRDEQAGAVDERPQVGR
jgi:hypothetical protein